MIEPVIAVVGLGYVGLPLAVAFGSVYETIGFDIDENRVASLRGGIDKTLEVTPQELIAAKRLQVTAQSADLVPCNYYLVTVPTPVNAHKQPDLSPLKGACETIAPLLDQGNTVVFESTVYPGATEEYCVPILERHSGLRLNEDFFVGYSPERINPGDKSHRLADITKITSGSSPQAAQQIDQLYSKIIKAGTHKASSIRVAEAAKVIENTQRDLNIALVNELALIFNRLGIDSREVLEAAGTKWNFLAFQPGLVGGHCIGVDPYYLTHKADEIGYHPRLILAGREINDGMGEYVANQVVKLMTLKKIHIVGSKILVLGIAFKENCPDLRNSRVIDVIETLQQYNAQVDVYDPQVAADEVTDFYGIDMTSSPSKSSYDAIVLAVSHKEFVGAGIESIRSWAKPSAIIYDVKSVLPLEMVDARL